MTKFVLKSVVSIIVFAVVIRRIDVGAVGNTVAGASVFFLILALLLLLTMIVTDAGFWRSVLGSLGHSISFGTAILYSFSGSFSALACPGLVSIFFEPRNYGSQASRLEPQFAPWS